MAEPKKKRSKTRTRSARSANSKIAVMGLIKCSHCGAQIRSHAVCPHCGFYKGVKRI